MQLSYSRLSAFMNCGLLYRLRYIEKVPARPKPHLGFGRILHSTLDRFYTLDTDHPTFDDLRRLYKSYWKTDSVAYKKHYAKGLSILKRYYELNIADYDRAVYVEQPFEIPIREHVLSGRFDRVDRIGHGEYEIIDYKAAKRVPAQAEVDAHLQLGIYALAFKLTTGKLPLVSFYFLPRNVKVTSQRTERELHRLRSGLYSIVDRMLSGEHFDPQEGVECKWCDYKRYCPLKTEAPLRLPRREFQPELSF
jgi:putative RecB family exonuclease